MEMRKGDGKEGMEEGMRGIGGEGERRWNDESRPQPLNLLAAAEKFTAADNPPKTTLSGTIRP